jgi:hypothetical protein
VAGGSDPILRQRCPEKNGRFACRLWKSSRPSMFCGVRTKSLRNL